MVPGSARTFGWRSLDQVPAPSALANPGSPTDRRGQPRYTWALMTIEAGAIAAVEILGYERR